MNGWIYRRAVDIRYLGERIRPGFIGRVVRDIGLALREWVLGRTAARDLESRNSNVAHRR
jgi:hypothetical protein